MRYGRNGLMHVHRGDDERRAAEDVRHALDKSFI